MQFALLLSVAGLASSILASSVLVKNNCTDLVYLTITRGSQQTTGPFELPAGVAYIEDIVGVGNSLGVTKTDQYYSNTTPKLIMGYSTSEGTIYWSLTSVDGYDFAEQGLNVTSTNGCGNETGVTGPVHSCADKGVTLTLNLCLFD